MNINDRIVIVKGCKTRGVVKGVTAQIINIMELGPDYSGQVQVSFRTLNGMGSGRLFSFYARHKNRLSDPIVNLNDGNPLHKIQIQKRA